MTRHKGRPSKRLLDRDYPHQVEIPIPGSGLRTAMHSFCRGRRYVAQGAQNRTTGQDAMRWCFAEASDADAFHVQFGGDRIAVAPRNTA